MGYINNITFKNKGKAFANILGNGEGTSELFKSIVSEPDKRYFFPMNATNTALSGYNLLDCTDVIFLSKYNTIYADKYYEFLTGSGGEQYYNTLTINYQELVVADDMNYEYIQQALQYPIIFDITIWLS